MINFEALFKVSYGLYIVCSGDKNKANGFISNTVFQITAEPPTFAASCNKNNLTAEFIQKYRAFSVSVLKQDASSTLIGKFGYKSGREIEKLADAELNFSETGVPVVMDETIAWLEFKLMRTYDIGTHLLFIGELINAEIIDSAGDPLTYQYYRQVKKGFAPKNAPTYIDPTRLEQKPETAGLKKYKCPACGYIYDEADENMKLNDLPDDWVCPACGTEKTDFFEI